MGFYHLQAVIDRSHHGLTSVGAPDWLSMSLVQKFIYPSTMYLVHHHLKILLTKKR